MSKSWTHPHVDGSMVVPDNYTLLEHHVVKREEFLSESSWNRKEYMIAVPWDYIVWTSNCKAYRITAVYNHAKTGYYSRDRFDLYSDLTKIGAWSGEHTLYLEQHKGKDSLGNERWHACTVVPAHIAREMLVYEYKINEPIYWPFLKMEHDKAAREKEMQDQRDEAKRKANQAILDKADAIRHADPPKPPTISRSAKKAKPNIFDK